jgi:hypothetical protein
MAHFAQIDENNVVINVIVVGDEYETMYADWRKEFGETYVQTSYNNRIRKQYAGIGYSYDPVADVFISPQPYPSWTLDENYDWQPPIPMPDVLSIWHEETQQWGSTF